MIKRIKISRLHPKEDFDMKVVLSEVEVQPELRRTTYPVKGEAVRTIEIIEQDRLRLLHKNFPTRNRDHTVY